MDDTERFPASCCFCYRPMEAKAVETQQHSQSKSPAAHRETGSPEIQQVCFMLAGGEYAIDISLVKEIIKPTVEPTPVPQSRHFVEGVIDLRGDIIPIIDLKKRFNIEEDDTEFTRILVIKREDIIVGFLVDSVTEVIRIRENMIQDAPGRVVGIDQKYIWGVTKRSADSPLIMLLDIQKILGLDEGRSDTAVPV